MNEENVSTVQTIKAHISLNLALNEDSFNERGALSHLGIQVASTEDVLAMRKQWARAGLYTRD